MSLQASEQRNEPVASTRKAAGPPRARARLRRAGLAAVTLLGTGALAAACTSVSSVKLVTGPPNRSLAFVSCMRTHGEPDMPDPVVEGNSVHITIKVGSGVDPRSPQFAAAFRACKYLTSPGKARRVSTGG